MKEFIKLVLKFTIIMLVAMGLIFAGVLLYRLITGKEVKPIDDMLNSKEESKTVLIAGLHTEGPLTDFLMVAKYNPETGWINAISIPRDTKVTGTVDGKINSAYARKRDINAVKEKVKQVTNLDVDNYAVLDTAALKKMVDAIGGVPFNVPIDMDYDDKAQDLHIHLTKGQQVLNGDKAEQFIRFRKNNDKTGYANGDVQRIAVQQDFIKAAISTVLKPSNITKLPELFKLGLSCVKTDITIGDVLSYVDDVKKFNKDNIRLEILPGEGMYIEGVSYYVCDMAKAKKLVEEMFINDAEINKAESTSDGTDSSGKTATSSQVAAPTKTKSEITVEVLNGTSRNGLASTVAEKLKDEGYNVTKIGNYKTTSSISTSIINKTKEDYAKDIKKILGKGSTRTEIDSENKVDVTVILGSDY